MEMHHREDQKSRAWKVLVVDDEALIRWSLRQWLEAEGYEVVDAPDARTAIERAPGTDLAVVDRRLPDGDGLAVSAVLHRRWPYRPVILMTALRSPELETAARDLGVDAIILKPFGVDQLLGIIDSKLGSC